MAASADQADQAVNKLLEDWGLQRYAESFAGKFKNFFFNNPI